MKIAIDVTPISSQMKSAHKTRGVGMYISMLRNNIEKFDKKNSYIFFERGNKLPKNLDLIHYPYFEPFFLTLPFIKKTKIVVTVHDLIPIVFQENFPVGIKGNIKWKLQKKILKGVDGIITDSNASKKDIVRITGIDKNTIDTVYLAVGKDFKKIEVLDNERKDLRKKYNLPERFLLYVGDATWNKNLPRLIDAVKDANVSLVLVGKVFDQNNIDSNSWNNDLVEVINETENDKAIVKTGFVDNHDLVLMYNIATALIMPSLYEGFGLPVLEAMKCGCPVITTKEGSLPEVTEEAALFVNANDVKSISWGIKEMFINNDLRDRFAVIGERQARKFTIKKMMGDIINVYEVVISKK